MRIYVIDAKRIKGALSLFITVLVSAIITVAILLHVDAKSTADASTSIDPAENKITTIIIDAGHGGEDPGAIGEGNVYEKDLNLAIATLLCEELRAKGYEVILTRSDDRMLYSEGENIKGMRKLSDLKTRCAIAAEHPEALFISIHMNSFGSSEYSGLQVYYSEKSNDGKLLASAVQDSVKDQLQKDNHRSIKKASGIYLLDNIKSTAVLVECGFLSNPDECQKLSEKEYQKELSLSIACGIIKYIERKSAADAD